MCRYAHMCVFVLCLKVYLCLLLFFEEGTIGQLKYAGGRKCIISRVF